MIHNDLTFFTNEPERNLYDRFNKILKSSTQFYDILVGYFRTSGFYLMYPAMAEVEKIRILVGLNVDQKTVQIIEEANHDQISFDMSHKEIKSEYEKALVKELQDSEDSHDVEEGVKTFISWLQTGKLEMRIYPDAPIHAKVYIMRKNLEKIPDQFGSVITGSSNFSKSGLANNLEFNVELKDSRDVQFALDKFEELWEKSINLTEQYVETINKSTWIRSDITPYELYLKTLYEYYKEEINEDKNKVWDDIFPDGFMKLQYQIDAVAQARKILNAHNGVFISDVVGLGKTYICAMLARRLKGRKLVICPPVLKDYWSKSLEQFEVSAKVESLGKLDSLLDDEELMKNTKYVFIDEAHRFRNQNTEGYQKLHQICYGKKVILVTATPQNNYSSDIASQLYLFQPRNNSTIIPNNKNLESFFNTLDNRLKKFEKASDEYAITMKANSEIIRNEVLRNIMIRRTRTEIVKYYNDDLSQQGLSFPKLESPEKIVYLFDGEIEQLFNRTMSDIQSLTYARYKPLTYLNEISKDVASLMSSQRNMTGFMKSILVKRLESSFYAFKKTLGRFILSYQKFLDMCTSGDIYISNKIDVYDLLDRGDDELLLELIDEKSVQHYKSDMFSKQLISSLELDLNILEGLKTQWDEIDYDPKLNQFINELENNFKIKNKKIIIFTESKETAEYLGMKLEPIYSDKTLVYSGSGSRSTRQEIEANFNPNYIYEKRNNIQILITTDVLAEGINLHRSNVLINYDLPWNPTRIMQRVGRINRVGSEHQEIFVFNFFPTSQANAHLSLEENILLKIQAFHDTLGEDFKYLSDNEELSTHKLYKKITTSDLFEEGDDSDSSDLRYLAIIREIRDNDIDLYEKIKKLPQKAKSSKLLQNSLVDKTISFIRKDGLKKFFVTDGSQVKELFFGTAIKLFEAAVEDQKQKISETYFDHLSINKAAFNELFVMNIEAIPEKPKKIGKDATVIKLLKALSRCKQFTDEQDEVIKRIRKAFEEGNVPSNISKGIVKKMKVITDPVKLFYEIIEVLPSKYYGIRKQPIIATQFGKTKVILSLFLKKE